MHHYRRVKCYLPHTNTVRECNAVTFFPKLVFFLRVKLNNFLQQAAQDIITILTNPPPTTTPTLEAGDSFRNALLTLATELKSVDTIPQQQQSHEVAATRVQTSPLLKHTVPP